MTELLTPKDLGCGIWLALDMDNFDDALNLTNETADYVDGIKVHGLVEDAMREKIARLRKAGAKKVWLDRKVDDIPSTVRIVSGNAYECGANRMTAMASAGIEAMMTACNYGPEEIVAVTDLTSLSKAEIGMSRGMPADASVLQKAQWARLAGVMLLVCSVEEVSILHKRRALSKVAGRHLELHGMKFIVPGSRTITTELKGQVRSNTAMATLDAGADELVLGSEVWEATKPFDALQQVYQAILQHKNQT